MDLDPRDSEPVEPTILPREKMPTGRLPQVPPLPARQRRHRLGLLALLALLSLSWVAGRAISAGGEGEASEAGSEELRLEPAARAAVDFVATPSAVNLRAVFDNLGGIDGLTFASADGEFDLVSFDPNDHDRLIASKRSSYGVAENQDENERWTIVGDRIDRALVAPDISHDFVHFNADGSQARWTHGGGDAFAPRVATLLDQSGEPVWSSQPIYASRFVFDSRRLFALTNSGDYYEPDNRYLDLVTIDEDGAVPLVSAEDIAWIDAPTSGVVVAYPVREETGTQVWNSARAVPLPLHPLAGKEFTRAAVSGDGSVGVGVTHSGSLEVVDMATGTALSRFGAVDVRGVDTAISMNRDGSVAVTVERDGTVTIWWVADGAVVKRIDGDSGVPRWVSEDHATRLSSVVSRDANRLALRLPPRPGQPTQWRFVTIDVNEWIERACAGIHADRQGDCRR